MEIGAVRFMRSVLVQDECPGKTHCAALECGFNAAGQLKAGIAASLAQRGVQIQQRARAGLPARFPACPADQQTHHLEVEA